MKQLIFVGDSRKRLKAFPAAVRHEAGFKLKTIQQGDEASDSKPLTGIASGVRSYVYGTRAELIE